MLMLLFTVPVYIAAALSAIWGRGITYAVTAKGDRVTRDRIGAFSAHLCLAGGIVGSVGIGLVIRHGHLLLMPSLWAAEIVLLICLPPLLLSYLRGRRFRLGAAAETQTGYLGG
jgi:hypothetical protein